MEINISAGSEFAGRDFQKLKVGICGVLRNIMSLNIEKQQGKGFFSDGFDFPLDL